MTPAGGLLYRDLGLPMFFDAITRFKQDDSMCGY